MWIDHWYALKFHFSFKIHRTIHTIGYSPNFLDITTQSHNRHIRTSQQNQQDYRQGASIICKEKFKIEWSKQGCLRSKSIKIQEPTVKFTSSNLLGSWAPLGNCPPLPPFKILEPQQQQTHPAFDTFLPLDSKTRSWQKHMKIRGLSDAKSYGGRCTLPAPTYDKNRSESIRKISSHVLATQPHTPRQGRSDRCPPHVADLRVEDWAFRSW